MCEEKSMQLSYKATENVCLDITDVYRNINKNDVSAVIENNTSINETPTEKISIKVRNFEQVTKKQKVHFETDQNKCSTNKETICRSNNLHSEKCSSKFDNETVTKSISSPVSVDFDEENFCCGSLSDSCIASAKFSMVISIVLLLISVQNFFKSSGEDDTSTKMLLFSAGVYALCYLHCARKLICGIEKDVRDKFVAWIGFSVSSVLLLFSGAIYVGIISWDELKDIHNSPTAGYQTIALILFLVLIGCILGLSFVALIILGSRLHQVDKEAGFLQVILNTWFRESMPPPPPVSSAGQTRGSGATPGGQRQKPMLTEQAQRTLLAFREDIRYFYRELDAARMTLILSIVFVGIFILSWWWMAFAIKQARSDGGVSLRTVLLLAVFAAVDVAASTGFILLRIIMYIRKDHLFPQEMRKPIPSLEYDQLAAYAALRLFTIQSSCGSIDILVIIVVGFLTGLRVYSVVCVFSYYKKAKNGSMDLFEHKNATGESDTSSRIERLKILDDYGAKTLVGKYSKRNGLASGLASLPRRGDRSRVGSVTGSTYDEDPPELKIQAADMPLEMQRSAVFSATQAIKLYSTEKHIAESIKQDFDTMYHPTWHCIVGRNWGSCVTHSKQCYVRLAYKDLTILLYRST